MLRVRVLGHVRLSVTPWTVARRAPLSVGFSWQEYWSLFQSFTGQIFDTFEDFKLAILYNVP